MCSRWKSFQKMITLRRELLVEMDQAGVGLIGVALLNEGWSISLLQFFFESYLDQSFQPTFDKFEAYFFKFWFAGIFDNLSLVCGDFNLKLN